MPRDRRDVEKALLSKGFQGKGTDHTYFVYVSPDGKKSIAKTKTSRSSHMKVIPDSLLGQMARQCKLNPVQFRSLVDCPLGRDDYEAILRNGGYI